MSNIRDLQKLKDTRKMQELGLLNKRVFNPERSTFNYDSISIKNPLQFNFNRNSQLQPEERLLSRGFTLHRRGSSFGMPQVAERFTASIMQNPKFSGYLCRNLAIVSLSSRLRSKPTANNCVSRAHNLRKLSAR